MKRRFISGAIAAGTCVMLLDGCGPPLSNGLDKGLSNTGRVIGCANSAVGDATLHGCSHAIPASTTSATTSSSGSGCHANSWGYKVNSQGYPC